MANSTEDARAAAFAKQADRSRELAAGHLQQAIELAGAVRQIKTAIDQSLRQTGIEHRWNGAMLEILLPNGEWQTGPSLLGPRGRGIVGAVINEEGHLILSYEGGDVVDAGPMPSGLPGTAATIEIEEVYTLPPGSDAEIENVGTTTAAILHIGLPRGADGEGTGDVVGPASAVNNRFVAFDGVTGKLLKDSGVIIGTSAGNLFVLDGSGKVPVSVLPEQVIGAVHYKGTWNASSNSPAIPAASADNTGWYRVVNVAGTTTIDGISEWALGDWIISNGSAWEKVDNSDQVNSVAGLMGPITAPNLRTALGLVIGDTVQAYDADTLKSDVDKALTAGYTGTAVNDGTKSSGTYTPTPAGGNFKRIVNGGAFTLAAPSASGDYTMVIQVTNNGSAGAVTLSGFSKTTGTFTTTNGDDFFVYITKVNGFIHASVVALQ